MADIIILIIGGLAIYLALSWIAHEYGLRTGWQAPEGSEASNWALRRNLAFALGGVAMFISAIVCGLTMDAWPARLVFMAQAALMAAAGASDLRKFHLPLPLTLAGIALGVIMVIVIQPPAFVVLFGLLWAVAVIVLHALASKGSMQLGDHIATFWIALVMPLNGMIAILAGDLTNVVLARLKGLRGKKVAAAGPWLLIAAALLALPPYFAWLQPAQMPTSRAIPAQAEAPITPANREALILVLDLAGDQTASVALANDHASRVAKAQIAAGHVRALAAYARSVGAETSIFESLGALADALARYDLGGIREFSARIAAQRAALERFTESQIVVNTMQSHQ